MQVTRAAISADSPLTAAAGARVARAGGNAVDIAVSTALAATVAEPLMCSLGGSGFFMVRTAEKRAELIEGADANPVIDTRPSSEGLAWRTAHLPYGDGVDVKAGHGSVAVPGMLAAAELAWQRHGSLPWPEIVAPALELARTRIPIGITPAIWLELAGKALFFQQPSCRNCFFPDGENPLTKDELFRIPNLDQTFEVIAEQGAQALYKGDLATLFAKEFQDNDGFISREDLAAYRAAVREPISLRSRGFQLALNPPPAVGGIAVGCLINLLQSNWRDGMTDAERALLHARSQMRLLGFRNNQLGDSEFDESVVDELIEDTGLAGNLSTLRSPNTTHLSVTTADGSMVGVTMSMGYGAGVIVPSLGINCNNSLGEPELNPRGFLLAQPGTRIVSNMAPTLAWHEDGQCVSVGSPGASRITTSIAQTWTRFALEGMSFEDAVRAPRLHLEPCSDGHRAQFEPGIDTELLGNAFSLRPFDSLNMYFGAIKLTALDRHGQFHAVADQRRQGAVEIIE